jgi:hypothetical protein
LLMQFEPIERKGWKSSQLLDRKWIDCLEIILAE